MNRSELILLYTILCEAAARHDWDFVNAVQEYLWLKQEEMI